VSGTVKTLRGKLSDGTIVEIRTPAKWDIYSWHFDGKAWHAGVRGFSGESVRSRAITRINRGYAHPDFEVVVMSEVMPRAIEDFVATPASGLSDKVIRIQAVFTPALGWVRELPGGSWPGSVASDGAFRVQARPTVSFVRLLARLGVQAITVGTERLCADFQMTELGIRLPKLNAAA
jgi:hypothetical protein